MLLMTHQLLLSQLLIIVLQFLLAQYNKKYNFKSKYPVNARSSQNIFRYISSCVITVYKNVIQVCACFYR